MTRIEQGQHLLKMIESVDVNDTATLDEIDEKIFMWFLKITETDHNVVELTDGEKLFKSQETGQWLFPTGSFTRSLDALHDAMPDGWNFEHRYNPSILEGCLGLVDDEKVGYYECWGHFYVGGCNRHPYVESKEHPTMHLAWLHAIIQAYIWEIENND